MPSQIVKLKMVSGSVRLIFNKGKKEMIKNVPHGGKLSNFEKNDACFFYKNMSSRITE